MRSIQKIQDIFNRFRLRGRNDRGKCIRHCERERSRGKYIPSISKSSQQFSSAGKYVAGVKLSVNLRLASLAGAKHYIIAVANYVSEQIYDLTGDEGVNFTTIHSRKSAGKQL